MLTAAHVVLLGADADAQACVAAGLLPVALGRLRRTCSGARGAAPVGVDWARLGQPSELAAAGELRALLYLYIYDKDNLDPFDTLLTAARQGRCEVVAWVLGLTRVPPNALLTVAASASHPNVFRLLTAAGLEHSPTALLTAVKYGNLAFLTAVLDAGVHPDSKVSLDVSCYSYHGHALISACMYGDLACARALLAAGADVDIQGGRGGFALFEAACNGHLECTWLLIEHSADVDARDQGGCTALMGATRAGQHECVRLLIEHKADVHARSNWGRTALNFSRETAQRDETACTRLVLEAGADVHAADDNGRTALMNAALYGERSLSLLLEAGADVHAADAYGFTPMLSACRHGIMQTILLLDRLGADPHVVSDDGTTALMLACSRRHGDIVRWLLDKKVDLDAVQNDPEGNTALMLSSGDQRRMLIEAGADLDATDAQGWTVLMYECRFGNSDAARELIAAGANTWESSEGKCAMELAAEGQHWDCITAVSQARENLQRACRK